MNVVLIAGLGPTLLETEDLANSLYDEAQPQIRALYHFNGLSHFPENMVYQSGTSQFPLLRKKKALEDTNFISEVLKSILSAGGIEYQFIPIKTIWEAGTVSFELKTPAIVCLSTTFMWNEHMIDISLDWIYEHINCKYLVIGGQYGVLKQDYLMSDCSDKISFLLTGEAELSLVPLINCLQNEASFEEYLKIPNLYIKMRSGKFCFTHHEEFDYRSTPRVCFDQTSSYIPYMSMRGCPYRCKFCALRECTPRWQYYTAERIFQDWQQYAIVNGAKHFSINDSTFFIPYSKILKLLELLQGSGFSWDANARADTPFDTNAVMALEAANCTALFFGFESMCDETLRKMDKLTTAEDNRRINKLFADSSIVTKMSFIVGFPGETVADYAQTEEYLVHEHIGRYSLYVFEYESDILPIGKDKEKYNLELLPNSESYQWAHAGQNWRHCGMDSTTARALRKRTIQRTRTDPRSKAVYRTWQDAYEWPFVPDLGKCQNIEIEKLLDQLVFAPLDAKDNFEQYITSIMKTLKAFNILLKK